MIYTKRMRLNESRFWWPSMFLLQSEKKWDEYLEYLNGIGDLNSNVLIVFDKSEVIASCIMQPAEGEEYPEDSYLPTMFYVSDKYRGQGIGTKLELDARSWAKELGYKYSIYTGYQTDEIYNWSTTKLKGLVPLNKKDSNGRDMYKVPL